MGDALGRAARQTAGVSVRFTFGSSGLLARQIENGAPYDVYLSANERFVAELVDSRRLLPDSVRLYALGRVGLWSKSGRYHNLTDLLAPGMKHLAIPNPAHAPYGVAAREALKSRGIWSALESRIVYGENVQQALQFAESGNADAVLTAWSLVFNKGGVLLPAEWHSPIRQTGAVVAGSRHPDAARRFLDFLTSRGGKALLAQHGLR